MDERQVKIMLMFGSDAGKLNAQLKIMEERFSNLSKRAEELKSDILVFKDLRMDASKAEQELDAVNNEIDTLSKSLEKARTEFEGMTDATRDMRENLYQLRDIGEKLNQIGMGMQNAGNTLLAPLRGAMAAYMAQQQAIKDAGGAMAASAKKYQDAQKQMQEAYIRIGAVAADRLLPVMETAADLVDKFADFIEKNPTLITAIAGLGVGLTAVGTVVSAVGQMTMLAGTLQGLGIVGGKAAVGGALAGTGPALASAGSALAPLIPVVVTAVVSYMALKGAWNSKLGEKLGNWGQRQLGMEETTQEAALIAAKQMFATATLGLASLGKGFDENTPKTWEAIKSFYGLGDAVEGVGKKAESTEQQLANLQFGQAFAQYQAETKQAEVEYYAQREKIMTDAHSAELNAQRSYQASLASINARYKQQTASTLANYNLGERKAEQDYYLQRAELVKSANAEVQQIERDHQERLRQLREDHEGRIEKLTANFDALGLVKENEAYEKSRREEERNANAEIAAKRKDIAMRLQEMSAQFALERQQRAEQLKLQQAEAKAQHDQQLKEQAAQYKLEQTRIREQKATQLKELEAQYRNEQSRRRNAFMQSIKDIDASQLNERNRRLYWYTASIKDADEFGRKLRAALAQNAESRDSGGTGRAGAAYLIGVGAQPELFVPNTNGTFIPNANRLTRSDPQITLQQEITFNGDLSAGNKAQFRSFMRTVAQEVFSEVVS